MKGRRTASYEILTPAGQEIVSVQTSIDGQNAGVTDGNISLVGKRGRFK